MKEMNTVLFDITKYAFGHRPHDILLTATDDIIHCVVHEYIKLYHKSYARIEAGTLSHNSQVFELLAALVPYYQIYATVDPARELKRRHPAIYRELSGFISGLIADLRKVLIEQINHEFYNAVDYHVELLTVRTKTWGVKYFVTYTRVLETLQWPQKL